MRKLSVLWAAAVVLVGLATLARAQPPASAQPQPGAVRATAPACTFAAHRCMTRLALDRRVQDKKLDTYCDQWKTPCLEAGFAWGGPAQ